MKKAVCLVSGGLDSCVTVADARQRHFELAFLHASYGQLTAEREERAFHKIAEYYGVESRLVVDLDHLGVIGGSALTDRSIPMPIGQLHKPGIPVSYVPFRNANLLSIAVSWAEVLRASAIFIGAVEEDSSGYPDCRHSFFETFERLIERGTRPETSIKIETPLIDLSKKEIVLRGVSLDAPLELTWSCYQNDRLACGRCDSCLLRLQGFLEAGVIDPIPYSGFSGEE